VVAPARCGPSAAGSFDCDRAEGLVIRLTHRRFRVRYFIQYRKVHGLKVTNTGRPKTPRLQALVCKDMRTRPQSWPYSWGLFSCCSSEALPSSKGAHYPISAAIKPGCLPGVEFPYEIPPPQGARCSCRMCRGSRCRAHGKSRRDLRP